MAGQHRPAILLFVLTFILVLAGDLLLKELSFRYVAGQPVQLTRQDWSDPHRALPVPWHQPVVVAPQILDLRLTVNAGAVFGLGQGWQWLFVAVSLLAVGVIGYIFWHSRARACWLHAALALILAGAVGNLYDRLRYNAVRDMLWLFPEVRLPLGLTWPNGSRELYPWIFNLADAALVVGVGILVVLMWRQPREEPAAAAEQG